MQVPKTPLHREGALSPLEQKRIAAHVLAAECAANVLRAEQTLEEGFSVLRRIVLEHYRFDPDGPMLWAEACRAFRAALRTGGVEVDEALPLPTLQYKPFPVHLLPETVRPMIEETAAALACDAGAVAPLALAVLGAAIGNTARLHVKRTWKEPCILWAALVADSGFAKSPLLRAIVAPVNAMEREARRAHVEATRLHKQAEAEARRRKETPPEAPVRLRYRTSNATVEALVSVLAGAPRGLLLSQDELSAWFTGFNRYSSGKGGDEAAWIEFHGGDASDTDRKTGEERTLSVDSPFVAVVGTIQPPILAAAFTPSVVASGLASRVLLAMPPTRALGLPDDDTSEEAEALYARVFAALYARPVPLEGPEVVRMLPDAFRVLQAFCNANARRVEALPSGHARAVLDKAKGLSARLALVLHLAEVSVWLPPDEALPPVPAATVQRACLLADWLAREAVRVASVLGVGQGAGTPAARVLETLPETWSRKDWDAAVKATQRGRTTASSWLEALVKDGDVERVQHGVYRAARHSPSRSDGAFLWDGYPISDVLGWDGGQTGQGGQPDNPADALPALTGAPGGDGAGEGQPLSGLSGCPVVQPNPPDAPF